AGRIRGDGVLAGVRLATTGKTLQAESQSRQAEGLSAFLMLFRDGYINWCQKRAQSFRLSALGFRL
ncbi:hypothetical protein, partial [Escherichia coli]|uniref:hypothetical protein n=1 Tax=Escherichia coli TaxID=562 RepID=UPI001ABD2D27